MKRQGQSTIEVVVLFIVIASALFLMRAYIQRGLQGKMKESADKIATPWTYEGDASHIAYKISTNVSQHTVEDRDNSGRVLTNYLTYSSKQNIETNIVEVDRGNRVVLFQDDY